MERRILRCVETTGVDDRIDAQEVVALCERYPFVEIGLLGSFSSTGTTRPHGLSPSLACFDRLREARTSSGAPLPLCLHVCGWSWIQSLFEGEPLRTRQGDRVLELHGFQRLQLNAKLGGYLMFGIDVLAELEAHVDEAADGLARLPRSLHEIVLQLDTSVRRTGSRAEREESRRRVERALVLARRFGAAVEARGRRASFLFDPSGGRGVRALDAWPDPVSGHSCGYVGGLDPGNVERAIGRARELLEQVDGALAGWVGSQSGVQEDGVYSPRRAAAFLQRCAPHVVGAEVDPVRPV